MPAATNASANHRDLPIAERGNCQPHAGWIVHLCHHQKTITIVEVEEAMVEGQVIIPHAIEVGVWSTDPHHLQDLVGLLEVVRMSFEEPMIGVATSKDCLPLHIHRHHHHQLMCDILTIGGEDQSIVALIVEDTILTKRRLTIWNDVFPC